MVVQDVAAPSPGPVIADRDPFDERWVPCERPVVVAGGAMTLDMLDLKYNPNTKFYDAPLHTKALNGMLLIDDWPLEILPERTAQPVDRANGEPDRLFEAR